MNMIHSSRKKRKALVTFLIYVIVAEVCLLPSAHALPEADAQVLPDEPSSFSLAQSEFTFIDDKASAFAVFKDGDTNQLPTTMGRVLWVGGRKVLVPTREIVSLEDMYLVKDPRDPLFLKVMEKLPQGGVGRLLRYRGFTGNGNWVDLEFVYQDKENGLTILDYESGRFFQTVLKEARGIPQTFLPSMEDRDLAKSLAASPSYSLKFIPAGNGLKTVIRPPLHWLRSQFEELSGDEIWAQRLMRGPPAGGFMP